MTRRARLRSTSALAIAGSTALVCVGAMASNLTGPVGSLMTLTGLAGIAAVAAFHLGIEFAYGVAGEDLIAGRFSAVFGPDASIDLYPPSTPVDLTAVPGEELADAVTVAAGMLELAAMQACPAAPHEAVLAIDWQLSRLTEAARRLRALGTPVENGTGAAMLAEADAEAFLSLRRAMEKLRKAQRIARPWTPEEVAALAKTIWDGEAKLIAAVRRACEAAGRGREAGSEDPEVPKGPPT